MQTPHERIVTVTWPDFHALVTVLAARVQARVHADSGPVQVVALARGGLYVGAGLAYWLRASLVSMHSEDVATASGPGLHGRTLVLADDIADSGYSLLRMQRVLQTYSPAVRTVTATLHQKAAALATPDCVADAVVLPRTTYVHYPWESDEHQQQLRDVLVAEVRG